MIIKTFFFINYLFKLECLNAIEPICWGGCAATPGHTKRKYGSQLPLTLLVHKYKEMDGPHKQLCFFNIKKNFCGNNLFLLNKIKQAITYLTIHITSQHKPSLEWEEMASWARHTINGIRS
jgi:hypothetical protein